MKRRLRTSIVVSAILACTLLLAASLAGALSGARLETGGASKSAHQSSGRTIRVTPWGPSQETIDASKATVMAHPSVQKYLKGTRHRLLHFEFVEPEAKATGRSEPPSRYRAVIYDYTNNRTIIATGRFDDSKLEVTTSKAQPNPSDEEFQEAVGIVMNDPEVGPRIAGKSVSPYHPMPPLGTDESSKPHTERIVNVGLMPGDGGPASEIVGANMVRQTTVKYEGNSSMPPRLESQTCGIQDASQPGTPRGTAGQYEVVISRGDTELWRFIVVRPSVSSGIDGSGIELLDVDFRGKRLLARATAPLLNVQYERNRCGPFRDWSWREGMFSAEGTDVAPGFRMCTSEPQTVIENQTDTGNFRGVALYDREEVLLMSELTAGWYRYVSMWIFKDDGIIQPRFGYGSVVVTCICLSHTHHVYWRLDFDIRTAADNSILETGLGVATAHEIEVMRLRQPGSQRQSWIVENSVSGESVLLRPNRFDGNTDKYGVGDVWLLRNKYPNEIDDSGQPGSGSEVRLNNMVNGEAIAKQDVVIWYAAHSVHDRFDTNSLLPGLGPYYHGPEIIIRNW